MDKITQQTETRQVKRESHLGQSIIGLVFGAIEILLGFRLGFKLLGADPGNDIVNGVYRITQYMVSPFENIFSNVNTDGIETSSVFEPATLIAMLIVALVAWGVMQLFRPRSGYRSKRTEYTGTDHPDVK